MEWAPSLRLLSTLVLHRRCTVDNRPDPHLVDCLSLPLLFVRHLQQTCWQYRTCACESRGHLSTMTGVFELEVPTVTVNRTDTIAPYLCQSHATPFIVAVAAALL